MQVFPSRLPVGAILGACAALAIAPLVYGIWHHSFSTLESFYLESYLKASVLPSHGLTGRPLSHRFYVVTVNGAYATPASMPASMQGVSGKFVDFQPSVFADWLRAAIYHGQAASDMIALPLITWAVAGLILFLIGGAYDFRRRQRAREGEQLRGPESMTINQFNRTTRKGRGFALRTKV